MAWRGLEGEDLKNNIRQLVIDFEPHIREAGNFEIAEETLLHLEENEQHFHRFEFVKQLKRKIDEALSPLIEDEIEKFAMAGQVDTSGQETLVSKITQCVIHSKPYCDMSRKMKRYITEAVEELIKNFDAEFGSGKHKETSDPLIYHRHSHHVDSDEEESSYDSSFHQGMLLLPNSEELQSVADKLHKSRDIQSKTEAMQILNQNMPADFINSDYWPQIRKNLLDVMTEPEELLTHLPLKFITRAFVTTSPQTREIYTMLAEYLIGQFQTRKGTIPKIKNGLDITNSAIAKLLKAFRLLNEFQQETTNYWIRYPDRYIEEILESTLNLFSIHQMGGPVGTSAQLSPIHFIAIIDPKAQWFIKWMHGNYSRHRLLKLLEKYRPIVVNAVRHCLDFSANRKLPFDLMSDFSDTYSKINVGGGRRSYYAGAELEYAYFIHSVHLLGRLLCFTNGRKFFPIKLKDSEDPITIKKLLVSLVLVVVDPSSFTTPVPRANSLFYEPATLVTEILKILCSHEQTAEICLYKDEITTALLSPVSQFLDAQCNKTETEGEEVEHNSPGESTLLHIADIVSMIASSTKGRRHLMYGERKDIFTRTKSSAAHIIAKFTKKALLGEIPRDGGTAPSKNVIGAYLYICRQLYNTCEGLLVLYQYELHNVIVRVWKEAFRESERTVTPTPSDNSSSDSDSIVTARHGNLDINAWEDTLRDNLLNFASSAKGLLLLQQTGAMNECMSYMYARYEKKLQVSKCEKFGYGYMVTQVAATAPGMIALQKTGYIKSLISEMWSVLECGASDTPLFTPKSWSVDTIDRSSHKHLIRLLNVLSAFPAVYEVLANKPLPSKPEYGFREIPTTIVDFVDRLIMVDSDAKIHSLFNFEQSHTFGLRVLSVMICCLDTFLLLQSQYNFQEILLSAQEDNHYPKENIILDLLSLERNHILVRSYLIGGPSERILPPRTIDENKKNGVFSFPLFSSYPVPREYVPSIGGRSTVKQAFVLTSEQEEDNDLAKFLSAKKPEKGQAWLDKCKTLFSKMLISKPDMLKGNLLQQLLEVGVPIMSKIQDVFPLLEYTGTDSALKGLKLSPLQKNGIKMAIRYGLHLKVIHNDVTDRLAQLLRQCSYYLKQQQKAVDSSIEYLHSVYGGFDWFAATIFLMFGGNLEKSWNFLHKFSTLGCSGYLWIPRLHCSVHLPSDLMCSGISPLFSSTGHNIELILQIELPLVASAFKMSGFTPAQICFHWLKQCFWNYLDWTEICQYVCLCIVMGIDYQVYLCCSILKHLQKNIMEHMQTQELIIYLKENAITGFHSSNYMTYMIGLEKKYRDTIFRDMLNITRP